MSADVVVIGRDDLRVLVADAVESAFRRREAERATPLSATAAAREAKRRTAVVLAALEAGELRGMRSGRAWRVSREDLTDWIGRGCPGT